VFASGAVPTSSFEVEILPPVSPSEAGPDPAEGGNNAEGAAPPRVMPDSAGAVYFEHACVFRGRRGLNTLSSCYKAVFLFLLSRVSRLVCQ
jgi:hypothetical protein